MTIQERTEMSEDILAFVIRVLITEPLLPLKICERQAYRIIMANAVY
jgi:hypothetical protein